MNRIKSIFVYTAVLALSASAAFAGVVPSGFTVSTADWETVTAAAVTGLGVIWGGRKVIKTLNRS